MSRFVQVPMMIFVLFLGSFFSSMSSGEPAQVMFTREESDWITAHPQLRVGVFSDLYPFEYVSGLQLHGLTSRYLQLISQRTGLSLSFVAASTRSMRLEMLRRGEIDLISSIIGGQVEGQDPGVLFTSFYHSSSAVLVARVADHTGLNMEQLNNKTVVTPDLRTFTSELQALLPAARVVAINDPREILATVMEGRADAAVAPEWLLIPFLYRQFQGGLQIVGGVPELQSDVSMAVRDDQTVLLSIMEKSLNSISGDDRKAIYDAWLADLHVDTPSIAKIVDHYDVELVILLIFMVMLVCIGLLSWQQRSRAMRNEREKAMFLAIMSHEIRSPMNAVLAAIELLGHTSLDERQQHFTGLASSGANTLLRLLDDVLDISRLEAGELKLNLVATDLTVMVQDVIGLYQLRAENKGLTLETTGEPIRLKLLLDDTRLAQVLRNLIATAILFTECGRIEVDLVLRRRNGQPEDQHLLIMRVSDTGVGFSEEVLASLLGAHADAAQAGSDLGLVISVELVKLMQGELRLSSVLGVGTTVTVTLPVATAPAVIRIPVAMEPAISASPSRAPLTVLRILVVEDTLANQEVLRAQLQGLGCEVLLAANAVQGLKQFAAQTVDLVLMDCDLPDQDGYSLASAFRSQELEQKRTYCPIIAISAQTGNEHLERCFDSGMDGAISKPIRLVKLQEVVEVWCNVTLTQQAFHITPLVQELSTMHEEMRRDLSDLLRATALRDKVAALHAVHRLHGAALILEWTDLAAPARIIEQLLRGPFDWNHALFEESLRIMVEHWCVGSETPTPSI